MLAAILRGVPRVIHEQNAIPGLANRALGGMASAVAVSFANTARFFPARRTQVTGNPVRAEIRRAIRRQRARRWTWAAIDSRYSSSAAAKGRTA